MKATVCRQNQTSGKSHNEESINIHFHISIFQISILLFFKCCHGGRIIHSNNLEIHTGCKVCDCIKTA